jgi:hypothetical protein
MIDKGNWMVPGQSAFVFPKPADPLDKQVGGDHYKRFPIQPVEYIRKNELGWYEGNIVKYVTRHKFKNGRQDIEKLIHMAECILKEYDDENRP